MILDVSQFYELLAWNILPQCHHLAPVCLWKLRNELNPVAVIPQESAAELAGIFNL